MHGAYTLHVELGRAGGVTRRSAILAGLCSACLIRRFLEKLEKRGSRAAEISQACRGGGMDKKNSRHAWVPRSTFVLALMAAAGIAAADEFGIQVAAGVADNHFHKL